MIFRALYLLSILSISNNGCATSSNEIFGKESDLSCTFEHSIGKGSIGPILLGSNLDELRDIFQIKTISIPYSNEVGYKILLCNHGANAIAEADDKGAVMSLSTTSPVFQTEASGRVGMSLEQLQALHPEGILSTGVEEGGWIAYRLDEIAGYFEFSLKGIAKSCLRNNLSCTPEFYRRPAIRYWAR